MRGPLQRKLNAAFEKIEAVRSNWSGAGFLRIDQEAIAANPQTEAEHEYAAAFKQLEATEPEVRRLYLEAQELKDQLRVQVADALRRGRTPAAPGDEGLAIEFILVWKGHLNDAFMKRVA